MLFFASLGWIGLRRCQLDLKLKTLHRIWCFCLFIGWQMLILWTSWSCKRVGSRLFGWELFQAIPNGSVNASNTATENPCLRVYMYWVPYNDALMARDTWWWLKSWWMVMGPSGVTRSATHSQNPVSWLLFDSWETDASMDLDNIFVILSGSKRVIFIIFGWGFGVLSTFSLGVDQSWRWFGSENFGDSMTALQHNVSS